MGHYVYKYVYDNEIIYIGKNDTDLVSRLNQHGKSGDNISSVFWEQINNSEIYFLEFENSIIADMVETFLINKYKPKCNIAKIIDADIPFIFEEYKYIWQSFNYNHKKSDKNVSVTKYNDLYKKYEALKTENKILNINASVKNDYINLLSCITECFKLLDSFKNDETKYKARYKLEEVKIRNNTIDIAKACMETCFAAYEGLY